MVKVVILAAGKGTRMKSALPKVLHQVMGKAMVQYSIDAAKQAGADEVCVIVGYEGGQVKEAVEKAYPGETITFAEQKEQLGTGHAVMCAKDFIGREGQVLILCGDTPLIKGETLKNLVARHVEKHNTVTMLSTILADPTGYGRIIRDENGNFIKNVEHKDATEQERAFKEVNSGMYLFEADALYDSLGKLKNDNAQNEYYLPDTLSIIKAEGGRVDAVVTEDETEIMGVNSKEQLSEAEAVMQQRQRA